MQTGSERQPAAGQRAVEFMQRNRRPIGALALAAALALVAGVAAIIAADALRGRAIYAAEDLAARYEALLGLPPGEAAEETDILLSDLLAFASRHSGYAGGWAWSMAAGISGRRGDWAEAEAAWLSAARAARRSHLEPFALFSAGAAAEEQGYIERAIGHYEGSISAPAGFFAAPRAQFSIGRLREALGDYDAAIRAYRDLVFRWPGEADFGSLARSRIVALETREWRASDPAERPPAAPAAPFGFGDFWSPDLAGALDAGGAGAGPPAGIGLGYDPGFGAGWPAADPAFPEGAGEGGE